MKNIYLIIVASALFLGFVAIASASEEAEAKKLHKIEISDKAKFLGAFEKFEIYSLEQIKQAEKFHSMSAEDFAELHNKLVAKIEKLHKIFADDNWENYTALLPRIRQDAEDSDAPVLTGKRVSTESAVEANQIFKEIKAKFADYTATLKEFYEFKYQQLLEDPKYVLPEDWTENLENIIADNQKSMKPDEVSSNDIIFAQNFLEIKTLIEYLNEALVDITYRAGWDEFGLAWIMLFFGAFTLYGGLFYSIFLDITKSKPCSDYTNAE